MRLKNNMKRKSVMFLLLLMPFMGAEATTLTFGAKFTQRNPIDMDPKGPSLGDYVPGSGDLYDKNRQVIGTFNVISTVTNLNATNSSVTRWVNAKYAFGSGYDSINIDGAETFETATGLPAQNHTLHYSVTGGTGKYDGARGSCVVARVNETDFVTVCKFSSMKHTFPDPSKIQW